MIFCDTSFALKLYVPEAGTAEAQAVLNEAGGAFVSELFRVELTAAFHRRLRERRCSSQDFRAVVEQFHHDDREGFWTWLPVDRILLGEAQRMIEALPRTIFLRAADCIHLATALHHGFNTVHTFDQHQAQAALALGLQVVPPPPFQEKKT